MEKATFVFLDYVSSDTVTHQGTYKSIQKYLNNGYNVKESRNGFWVLTKPAQVFVTIEDESKNRHTFNMKEDILDYYGKTRISEKLATRFERDAKSGKIQFFLEDNYYSFN